MYHAPHGDFGCIFQHAFTGKFCFSAPFIFHFHFPFPYSPAFIPLHPASHIFSSPLFHRHMSYRVICTRANRKEQNETEQERAVQHIAATSYTAEYNAQKKPRYYF